MAGGPTLPAMSDTAHWSQRDTSRCPRCGRKHRDEVHVWATYCRRCRRQIERRRQWAEASGEDVLELCARIGVSRRFFGDGGPPDYSDPGLAERIAARPLPKGGLLITGPVGSHKTHLLAARCVDAARRGFSARLVKWTAFVREVRATYQPGARETESDVLRRYARLDYVGLDDFGIGRADCQETDAALRLAYDLLDERYRACRTTDVSTNWVPTELAERFDERIARRLRELCTVYPMLLTGADAAHNAARLAAQQSPATMSTD